MIELTVKGLAKFMTASPAGQRKVLHDYKHQDDDEPTAMRLYYKDATDLIRIYHQRTHNRDWLRAKVKDLLDRARMTPGAGGTRLRHNARGLSGYEQSFAHRQFDPQGQLRLRLDVGGVSIRVTPDLHVLERGKARLVKLEFATNQPSDEVVRIVSQVMFEAARARVSSLTSSSILLFDVARGKEHRGARAGARTLREIEAACKNIENIWPGI